MALALLLLLCLFLSILAFPGLQGVKGWPRILSTNTRIFRPPFGSWVLIAKVILLFYVSSNVPTPTDLFNH